MLKEDLINQLKQKDSFLLAIDGKCGSGKSTLADELQHIFGGHVFHMDDFYLPLEKRTEERLKEAGGNVEYERFLETVLIPLSQGKDVVYQKFNCSKMAYDEKEVIKYSCFNIIEGSYCLKEELCQYYSDIVVLNIDDDLQIERLLKRNPSKINVFKEKWIPMENNYFQILKIMERYPVIHVK